MFLSHIFIIVVDTSFIVILLVLLWLAFRQQGEGWTQNDFRAEKLKAPERENEAASATACVLIAKGFIMHPFQASLLYTTQKSNLQSSWPFFAYRSWMDNQAKYTTSK